MDSDLDPGKKAPFCQAWGAPRASDPARLPTTSTHLLLVSLGSKVLALGVKGFRVLGSGVLALRVWELMSLGFRVEFRVECRDCCL